MYVPEHVNRIVIKKAQDEGYVVVLFSLTQPSGEYAIETYERVIAFLQYIGERDEKAKKEKVAHSRYRQEVYCEGTWCYSQEEEYGSAEEHSDEQGSEQDAQEFCRCFCGYVPACEDVACQEYEEGGGCKESQ